MFSWRIDLQINDPYVLRLLVNQAHIENQVLAYTRREAENALRTLRYGTAWSLDKFAVRVFSSVYAFFHRSLILSEFCWLVGMEVLPAILWTLSGRGMPRVFYWQAVIRPPTFGMLIRLRFSLIMANYWGKSSFGREKQTRAWWTTAPSRSCPDEGPVEPFNAGNRRAERQLIYFPSLRYLNISNTRRMKKQNFRGSTPLPKTGWGVSFKKRMRTCRPDLRLWKHPN